MDTQLFSKRLGLFIKHNSPAVILFLIGLLLFGYGVYLSLAPQDEGIIIETQAAEEIHETYYVDVEGAVNKPGVYELAANLRYQDALIAAGGLAADADRERISLTINLAQKLTDGIKIYFPFVGDTSSESSETTSSFQSTAASLININSASEVELVALNGIGPATAKKIMEGRPFTTVEELLAKKILSSKTYEQLKDQLTAY